MATFLFSYRVPNKPLAEVLGELDETAQAERIAAWTAWFESMGAHVLQSGDPVVDARGVGNCDAGTRIGGYSLVTADDLEAAMTLAKGCPGLAWGGGVEVGAIMDLDRLAPATTQ